MNHENETVTYYTEIKINGTKTAEIGPVLLGHEEIWEEEIFFVPSAEGENQKVEFLLYRKGIDHLYRSLRLWVDVK